MGRQMKKIEDKQQRNIAFAKRKNGLLKKAYELYALCDVHVALIFFSPSGKLFVFNAKGSVEEIIHKYVSLPTYMRQRFKDETIVKALVDQMLQDSMRTNSRESRGDAVRYQIQPKAIEDEIEKYKAELAEVDRKLDCYLKSPNKWDSLAELQSRMEKIGTAKVKVQSRKRELLSQNQSANASLENSSVE
ncbi:agamous-like MADS-box protein AGL66 [Capsella rubella]|uniref:agamous-like MADS-box protein AGL66 n=1 Tax=Capsella rubella TaxID=81985 RepID=UPI000CD4EDDD|nr:agamous-like MADS-box protein AGL66 [Capsella rubella]